TLRIRVLTAVCWLCRSVSLHRFSSSYVYSFFFFNDTATTEIYTLSLHDALPISDKGTRCRAAGHRTRHDVGRAVRGHPPGVYRRSEEHTSELQSRENLVCRLLLEKKKKKKGNNKKIKR